MRIATTFASLAFAVSAAGCGSGSNGGTADAGAGTPDAPLGPVPDAQVGGPDADLGCTPVAGEPALGLEVVAEGLDSPVFVTSPPGDPRLFILEQGGTIRIVKNGTLLPTPFLDISGQLSGGNEQGLLGLAFPPDYATSGKFYVDYTDISGDSNIDQFRVSTTDPDRADPASQTTVLFLTQPYPNHNGGMLAFGPNDGFLYIAFGDGGLYGDPAGNGQNRMAMLGKLLRIDVSMLPYTAPPSNPFFGSGSALAEIWAYGVRNPWRFSFDRETADMYIGDVGQDAWEEVDVQPAASGGGENYGWDIVEGDGHCYDATTCDQTSKVLPIYDYSHGEGNCVIGGYVYRGCKMPGHHGKYFFADNGSGWVRSFRWDGAGGIADLTDWPSLDAGSITSFGQDAAGELYICTRTQGRVYRIVPQ